MKRTPTQRVAAPRRSSRSGRRPGHAPDSPVKCVPSPGAAEQHLEPQRAERARLLAEIHGLKEALDVQRLQAEADVDYGIEALKELEYSRQRYVDLYESAPIAYITLDHHGCIRRSNLT